MIGRIICLCRCLMSKEGGTECKFQGEVMATAAVTAYQKVSGPVAVLRATSASGCSCLECEATSSAVPWRSSVSNDASKPAVEVHRASQSWESDGSSQAAAAAAPAVAVQAAFGGNPGRTVRCSVLVNHQVSAQLGAALRAALAIGRAGDPPQGSKLRASHTEISATPDAACCRLHSA